MTWCKEKHHEFWVHKHFHKWNKQIIYAILHAWEQVFSVVHIYHSRKIHSSKLVVFPWLIKNQWSSQLNKTQCPLGEGFQRRQMLIDKKESKKFCEPSKHRILYCRQKGVQRKIKGNKPGMRLLSSCFFNCLFFFQKKAAGNDWRLRAE